ncbi:MAG: hypothetical protein Q4B03_01395 [Lachnospiraceae bacterium]|nr:hypothetical protein [Lachnospiraceae bacterium]
MKRNFTALFSALVLSSALLSGCGSTAETTASSAASTSVQSESAAEAASVSSVSAGSEAKSTETAETEIETAVSSISAESEAEGEEAAQENPYGLEDGEYIAEIDTDSSMFHINEALDGKGTLTVENGAMTIHMTLAGTGILNLYQGSAEEAQEEGAELIEYTVETVTYSDGLSEDVYAFDVPCPVLDEEFPVAIIGKKGKWYDHTVIVSNPVKAE